MRINFVKYPDRFYKLKDKRSAQSESMRLKLLHITPFINSTYAINSPFINSPEQTPTVFLTLKSPIAVIKSAISVPQF